jgi:hypothetical protein
MEIMMILNSLDSLERQAKRTKQEKVNFSKQKIAFGRFFVCTNLYKEKPPSLMLWLGGLFPLRPATG